VTQNDTGALLLLSHVRGGSKGGVPGTLLSTLLSCQQTSTTYLHGLALSVKHTRPYPSARSLDSALGTQH
jgi:hypothetical protein